MNPQHYEPKRIYIAERNPKLSREQFIQRWRQHGALAMSFMARQNWANVILYVHCDAIHDHGIGGFSDCYDGMGVLHFRDQTAREQHIGFTEARAALAADEEETFKTQMKYGLGNVTHETVLLEGPALGVKVVYCRQLTDKVQANRHAQRRASIALRAFGGAIRRYVQSIPVTPENGSAWGLQSDLIEELWFDDVVAVRKAFNEPEAADFHADRADLSETPIVLLTREVVLSCRGG